MNFENILAFPIGGITVQTILVALIWTVIGLALVSLIMRGIKKLLSSDRFDDNLTRVLLIVCRVVLYAIVVLVVADSLGLPITSLLAVLSVAGLAVSLAIQDTLANVFSGLLLLASKIFVNGEYVQIGTLEGTVTQIDLMNTHLRTADNKAVRIPNKDVQAAAITNYSREENRRVDITVSVAYTADTEAVKAALLKAADRADVVLKDPAPFAGLFAYQSSSIDYKLQAWTKTPDYWTAFYALTEGVRAAFAEDGIEMTYDHLRVHVEK
ncbi:MAG: mechanosensitive ion channel family protein [Clostridia bacterium]|nr:mechanosensitive ion channel family protein [Clostridia bacterium]